MYLDVTKTPYAPDNEEDSSDVRTLMAQYESYKRWFEEDITYDQIIQSINCNMYSPQELNILDFERKAKLHWVRIFFSTPTFDMIVNDEKANFELKMSTIGGTMGLLTGFSIISGVEIVFFLMKSIITYWTKQINNK